MAVAVIGLVSGAYAVIDNNGTAIFSAAVFNHDSDIGNSLVEDISKNVKTGSESVDSENIASDAIESSANEIKTNLNSYKPTTTSKVYMASLSYGEAADKVIDLFGNNSYGFGSEDAKEVPKGYDYTDKYTICAECGKYFPLGNVTRTISSSMLCPHNHTITNLDGFKESYIVDVSNILASYLKVYGYEKQVNTLTQALNNNARQIPGTFVFVPGDGDFEDKYLCCCECGGAIYLGEHNNQLKDYQKCPEFKSIKYITPDIILVPYETVLQQPVVDPTIEHEYDGKIDQMTFDYVYNLTTNPNTPILSPEELKDMYGEEYYPSQPKASSIDTVEVEIANATA